MPRIVTHKAEAVAEQLQVPITHVYELRKKGRLQAVNVGTERRPMWRFPQSAIEKFMRDNAS